MNSDLDRFKEPDEERKVMGSCAYCGEEILEGDSVALTYFRSLMHDDERDCGGRYAFEEMFQASGVIDERGAIE